MVQPFLQMVMISFLKVNNSFELRLSSGGSVGEVTLNLLETGPLDLQIGANEGQFMEIRIQNLAPRALGINEH